MGENECGSRACMLELYVIDEMKKGFSSVWDYSLMMVLCCWKS